RRSGMSPSNHKWKQALVDTPAGRLASKVFFGLAEGPRKESAAGDRFSTIIAGSFWMNPKEQQGIFLGSWDRAGDLILRGADLPVRAGGFSSLADTIAVASSPSNLQRAYAAASPTNRPRLMVAGLTFCCEVTTAGRRGWK